MPLLAAVDEYVRHIRVERGFSERTRLTYQAWLRHLARWFRGAEAGEPDVSHLTTKRLREFAAYLVEKRGHQAKSVHSAFNAIRSFTAYLRGRELIHHDPCAALQMPKRRSPQRAAVSDAEVCRLLAACEELPDRRSALLTRAIIAVLAFAGLRRQELRTLKVADVSFESGSITVRVGKGGKARKVYVHQDCLAAVRAWLDVRGDCDHDWLWAHNRRWGIGYDRIGKLVDEARAQAGLSGAKHITPHAFRHGWATRLMLGGAPLLAIKDALGHASIQTTQAYLHSDEKSQRELARYGELREEPAAEEGRCPRGGQSRTVCRSGPVRQRRGRGTGRRRSERDRGDGAWPRRSGPHRVSLAPEDSVRTSVRQRP